jgi:hypothetical protein
MAKKSNTLLWVILLVGAGVLIPVAGCCGALFYMGYFIFDEKGKADFAANAFLSKIASGDLQGAYDSGDPELRSAQTFEEFSFSCKSMDLQNYESANWNKFDLNNDLATINGSITFKSGVAIAHTVTLRKVGNGYQVIGIKMPNPGLVDPKTLKPPADDVLLGMVNTTVGDLVKAIESDNFRAYMRTLPEAVVRGKSANDFRDMFKEFIEKKIDLSATKSGKPNYDTPPTINETGTLIVTGHYPSDKLPVKFAIKYNQILGEWKMTAIDISTKRD